MSQYACPQKSFMNRSSPVPLTAHAIQMRYAPERIWTARERYFDQGLVPSELLNPLVIQSWERCRQLGRDPHEHVEFDPVERTKLASLLESEHDWLDIAQTELNSLSAAIAGAGYVAMLTNAAGAVLAVTGALDKRSKPLRWAFRPGVDVSERSIGTSAMGIALAERQAVSIQGGEHFFANNQLFHCFAAPIFDPRGVLLGCLDVTCDAPGFSNSVRVLTMECAAKIENRLFDRHSTDVRVDFEAGSLASIAFDQDGVLVATSSGARRLIDMPVVPKSCTFEDLFEGRFEHWAAQVRQSNVKQPSLHLRGGVQLAVQRVQANRSFNTVGTGARTASAREDQVEAHHFRLPSDPTFRAHFAVALKAHSANVPVLISGETGTGKEIAARTLHAHGDRANAPFVALNCGALPAELIASELFGHAEGAFTGAAKGGRVGKIAAAHGGTVLLDEIGEMPLALQVALLRVLDTGEVLPVGSAHARQVDVRFVCATNRNLDEMVRTGQFRADLFYRISGLQLTVPALRERSDFESVVAGVCAKLGVDACRIAPDALQQMAHWPWPGNVRQLQHVLRLAFAVHDDTQLLGLDVFNHLLDGLVPDVPTTSTTQHTSVSALNPVEETLQRCGGDVAAAAAALGISRATFYRRRKALQA